MAQKKIKKELLGILECPLSALSLHESSVKELEKILARDALENHTLKNKGVSEILINENNTIIYLVKSGIPILDPAKAIIL